VTYHPNPEQGNKPATTELPVIWRRRATALRQWAAAEGAATAWDCAADELDAAVRCRDDER